MRSAKLEVYCGPVASGKTTAGLIRLTELISHSDSSKKGCNVSPTVDNRETIRIAIKPAASVTYLKQSTLQGLEQYDFIHIDEAQFFEDLVIVVKNLLSLGKFIIVTGLDGTYLMESFGKISELLPLADVFIKRTAFCSYCVSYVDAPFSKRLIKSDETILIGGDETYKPTCRFHHK